MVVVLVVVQSRDQDVPITSSYSDQQQQQQLLSQELKAPLALSMPLLSLHTPTLVSTRTPRPPALATWRVVSKEGECLQF